MNRKPLVSSVTVCLWLGLATPLLAAQPVAGTAPIPPAPTQRSAADASQKCLTDLQAFNSQTQKDGYWLGSSAYGFGFPMGGFGNSEGYPAPQSRVRPANGYQTARSGYDVRMLLIAANILARHGQQQACEDVLATTSDIYKVYAADMQRHGLPKANISGWWQQQIAAAKPVIGENVSFRSDQLLGVEVRNSKDTSLGTVHDIVMNPLTGTIAYLVIGRGGIFGIDEKYVPVPWEAFKTATNVGLLVLDASKDVMGAAPQVKDDQFSVPGQFDQESQAVDTYWKAHLSASDAAGIKG